MSTSTVPTNTTVGAEMVSDRMAKVGGVVLMAGVPAVFWAYVAKFVLGLFGVALSTAVLAGLVATVFLFLGCVVSGFALRS
jgi:uncharacterized membrane protein